MWPAPSAGKRVRASHDWFLVLYLVGGESGASFTNQSKNVIKQNQSKRELLWMLNKEPAKPKCEKNWQFTTNNKAIEFDVNTDVISRSNASAASGVIYITKAALIRGNKTL